MADAVFNEVLQMTVDTTAFAQQMKEVEQIYARSIANMPNIGQAGALSLSESLTKLNTVIDSIRTGTTAVLTDVGKVMLETANQVEVGIEKMVGVTDRALSMLSAKTKEQESSVSGFFRGFNRGFTGALATAVKFSIAYRAVGLAIEGVTKIASLPFKAFKDGFKYLEDFQERSSQLKAALLQSEKFVPDPAKDAAKNYQLAGKEADRLTKQVDDLSVKLRVQPKILQTAFESFVAYGGRNLVHSNDEAMKLSGILVAALQAQNPNIQTRKIQTEVQQLAQGQEGSANRLGAALGLSNTQLQEMSKHARTTHDLFNEIVTHASGLTDRLAEANTRAGALQDTFELMAHRLEGSLAEPLFNVFVGTMQKVIAWLQMHDGELTDFATRLGVAVGRVARDLSNAFKADNFNSAKTALDAFVTSMQVLGVVAAEVMWTFRYIGTELDKMQTSGKFWEKLATFGLAGRGQTFSQLNAQQDALDNTLRVNDKSHSRNLGFIINSGQSIKQVIDSFHVSDPTDPNQVRPVAAHGGEEVPNQPAQGVQPSKADEAAGVREVYTVFKKVEADYKEHVATMKLYYQQLRDAADENAAAGTMTLQQHAAAVTHYYNQEVAEARRLLTEYKAQIAQFKDLKPSQRNQLSSSADMQFAQMQFMLDRQRSSAQQKANRDTDQQSDINSRNALRLQQQDNRDQLQMLQEAEKSGYMNHYEYLQKKQELDVENHNFTLALLQDEVDHTLQGTKDRLQAEFAYTQEVLRFHQQMRMSDAELQREEELEALQQRRAATQLLQAHLAGAGETAQYTAAHSPSLSDRVAAEAELLALRKQGIEAALDGAEAELAYQKAMGGETEATRRLEVEIANLRNQRQQAMYAGLDQRTRGESLYAQRSYLSSQLEQTGNQQGSAQNDLASFQRKYGQNAGESESQWAARLAAAGMTEEQYRQRVIFLTQKINDLAAAVVALGDKLKAAGGDPNQPKGQPTAKDTVKRGSQDIAGAIFGPNFLKDLTDPTKSLMDKFGTAVQGAVTALGTFSDVLNAYKQGKAQGGVLGGIGNVLSNTGIGQQITGTLGGLASAIPGIGAIAGPIVSSIGSIFSFLGGLFTSEARKIAEQIQNQITAINNEYSAGQQTLNATLQQLEAQRQQAIARLSGVKGGQDQLNKILSQLDPQIDSMKNQMNQTNLNFINSMNALSAGGSNHTDVLAQWVTTWQQINKQVTDYLNAVGVSKQSLQAANQFLQLNLRDQQKQLIDQYNQGEQQAIQDAISLNNLIQQRLTLEQSERTTEFGILNGSAEERRASSAVTVAQQLKQQRAQYNLQLVDLNNQITLTQQKVDLEKQVFNIASDTATLQLQSNQLTLYALQEQLQTMQSIAALYKATNGFTFKGNPLTGTPFISNTILPPSDQFIPGLSGSQGVPTDGNGFLGAGALVVQITLSGVDGTDPTQLGTSIGQAIQRQLRTGKTQY